MARPDPKGLIGLLIGAAALGGTLWYLSRHPVPPVPPPPPGQSLLVGHITDAATSQGIGGAVVLLDGSARALTSTDGGVQFTAFPGDHTLGVEAVGYEAASRSVTLIEGVNDLGFIPLTPLPGPPAVASVAGRILDLRSGSPLPNVAVSILGQLLAVTGVDGGFTFTVPPGEYALDLRLDGYLTTTVYRSLTEGPNDLGTLYLAPLGLPEAVAVGVVVDGVTGAPLSGVSITLDGVADGATMGDGSFLVETLAGPHTVGFRLTGYAPASLLTNLESGVNDLGVLPLSLLPPPPPPPPPPPEPILRVEIRSVTVSDYAFQPKSIFAPGELVHVLAAYTNTGDFFTGVRASAVFTDPLGRSGLPIYAPPFSLDPGWTQEVIWTLGLPSNAVRGTWRVTVRGELSDGSLVEPVERGFTVI